MLFLIYFSERVNADLSGLLPVTTSVGEPAVNRDAEEGGGTGCTPAMQIKGPQSERLI